MSYRVLKSGLKVKGTKKLIVLQKQSNQYCTHCFHLYQTTSLNVPLQRSRLKPADTVNSGLTDTLFGSNVTILLFFLSLYTPGSILEYLHTSCLFFFCFLRLSFLGDFHCFCPSIEIPSSFSFKALFTVSLTWWLSG